MTLSSHHEGSKTHRQYKLGATASLWLRRLAPWLGVAIFLGVFFFYPIARILGLSLNFSALDASALALTYHVLLFTFSQAFFSTLLTFLLGLPAAFLFTRYQFRGKSLLRALTAIPFILPTVVVAAGFSAWLGPRGWLNIALMDLFQLASPPIRFTGTLAAILLAHVFYNATIIIRMTSNALAHFDPRLDHAARTLGANSRRVFWHVTFPLLRPALLAAALLVFIFDFTSFGVILLLGGSRFSSLEVETYQQAIQLFNLPMAAWLSLIQLLCTLAFSILYTRVSRRFVIPNTPRLSHPRKPHSLRERFIISSFLILLSSFFILPLSSLPIRSLTRLEADLGQRGQVQYGLTVDYYTELFINRTGSLFYVPPVRALFNSLGYATLTMVLSIVIGFPAASALSHPGRIERFLDPLLLLPLGVSSVTLGLGFILSFGQMLASPWMVPLAHTLIALPFVIRTLQPALASIPERLRQAAASLGASPVHAWFAVDWPIVRRATLTGAVFAFTISLGEFGATALVSRPEYPTLPMAIYRFISQPGGMNYGQAMAMATILMCVCGAGILYIEKFRLPGTGEF